MVGRAGVVRPFRSGLFDGREVAAGALLADIDPFPGVERPDGGFESGERSELISIMDIFSTKGFDDRERRGR